VIGGAIDAESGSTEFANDAAHIWEDAGGGFRSNKVRGPWWKRLRGQAGW
jgi:hypothetical protein